jgi:Zn finger protein HypA/HybF involved in hydrogenase expression
MAEYEAFAFAERDRKIALGYDVAPIDRTRCACGHLRGLTHNLTGCLVGREKFAQRTGTWDEPYCYCRGFVAAPSPWEVIADLAGDIVRKAEADFWCNECDDAVEEPATKYECGNCGAEFTDADEDSNRCPGCNRFAAKVDGDFCPNCGGEVEDQRE